MNLRQKRLADAIRNYSTEDILSYEQLQDHTFGIISVVEVEVSPDYSYADIYVSSSNQEKLLPKFLSPCAQITRKRIGKDFSLRIIPNIRYKIGKKQRQTQDVLDIINSLDRQYGLSQSPQS